MFLRFSSISLTLLGEDESLSDVDSALKLSMLICDVEQTSHLPTIQSSALSLQENLTTSSLTVTAFWKQFFVHAIDEKDGIFTNLTQARPLGDSFVENVLLFLL